MKDDNFEYMDLNLEELEKVTGGRRSTTAEGDDLEKQLKHTIDIINDLLARGHKELAQEWSKYFYERLGKWSAAINAAPEGSPDIPFSDYYDPVQAYYDLTGGK